MFFPQLDLTSSTFFSNSLFLRIYDIEKKSRRARIQNEEIETQKRSFEGQRDFYREIILVLFRRSWFDLHMFGKRENFSFDHKRKVFNWNMKTWQMCFRYYIFDVEHKLECCDIEYIKMLIKLYKDVFKMYLLVYEKILFCEI
jgi:hypothetical protein